MPGYRYRARLGIVHGLRPRRMSDSEGDVHAARGMLGLQGPWLDVRLLTSIPVPSFCAGAADKLRIC